MSYLRYLCLFAYSDVQHILCCVFVLLSLMLPVSLDCPFLIAPSVFLTFSYYNLPYKQEHVLHLQCMRGKLDLIHPASC